MLQITTVSVTDIFGSPARKHRSLQRGLLSASCGGAAKSLHCVDPLVLITSERPVSRMQSFIE